MYGQHGLIIGPDDQQPGENQGFYIGFNFN